ncbi:hypothetical protein L9F63_014129, partial [Diploptera punctata]
MKYPIRPAPRPPSSSRSVGMHRSLSTLDDWGDGDPFTKRNFTNRPLSVQWDQPPNVKKKPPPRPPPPKFPPKNPKKAGLEVPNRPSSLLSGLFNRNSSTPRTTASQSSLSNQNKNNIKKDSSSVIATASLIDLHSPSCSPTPTTRSSSDGLSVNSFGSDGSTSNNGHTTGGGGSSLFESGFEDDFDFFGGLSSSSSFGTPLSEQKDPWSVAAPQDPFSPPRQQNTSTVQKQSNSSTTFYTHSSTTLTSLPTIIRAKPGKQPLPKLSDRRTLSAATNRSIELSRLSPKREIGDDDDDENDSGNCSPPMPSIPPPPLPPEALLEMQSECSPPDLPPRPAHLQEDVQEPHGIALYDYPASHPDDLSFYANDKIVLLHQVNNDWYFGQKGQNQGMFPVNFIKVVVPLNNSESKRNHESRSPENIVKAIYPFSAETWDDLEFQEGASIYVLSKINDDWLYGECSGKKGQFPAGFVDHIPSNLPQHLN